MRKNYFPTTPKVTELEPRKMGDEHSKNKAMFLSGNG